MICVSSFEFLTFLPVQVLYKYYTCGEPTTSAIINLGTLIGDDFVHPPKKKYNQKTHSFFLHPTFVLGLPKKKHCFTPEKKKRAFFEGNRLTTFNGAFFLLVSSCCEKVLNNCGVKLGRWAAWDPSFDPKKGVEVFVKKEVTPKKDVQRRDV